MGWLDEQVSAQFARWEEQSRGWQVWPQPVAPEPPFIPFLGYAPNTSQVTDDGRRPSRFTTALTKIGLLISPPVSAPAPDPEPEPEAAPLQRGRLVELQLSLPPKLTAKPQEFVPVLAQLAFCREPVAFEILGTAESIVVQFTVGEPDAPALRRLFNACFPEVVVTESRGALATAWQARVETEAFVLEFGLGREFLYPLASPEADPYIALIAPLTELAGLELGLFQVIFQAVEHPWADSLLRAVTNTEARSLFINAPEWPRLAQEKTSSPLFAAVVRLATRAEDLDQAINIARDLAGALRAFGRPDGNELIPLRNDEYPYEAHTEDVVGRQCRRTGMLLNTEELNGFLHLPSAAVRSSKLRRELARTKAAPKLSTEARQGLLLGRNTHAGQTLDVRLSPEERSRHTHLIGASGTGKSTLLFNLIRQDIENGEGLAVLDPHGDLVERILGIIPPHRIADVVLIDGADEAYSVGFNILSAHSDLEKTLLASDLVSVFQRLSTSWGDQMGSVLQNAILAFLESEEGGTLAELRRFLIEPQFRKQFLATVADPDVHYYWEKGFPQLSGNKSIGPVLTRLETFLAPKPIRYMVSQRENRLDFAQIMDTGKIFLAKLAQGQIGKENAFLLGSLFVAKFQETAMSRQRQDAASRRPFWLYIDEFHNFITPSMAEILSGARKYRLGSTLAHQELRQLQRDPEVASAVLSNCYTRAVFRVGDDDARKLAEGFSGFEAKDLQNLDRGQAICRLERSDHDFNLSIPLPHDPDPETASQIRQQVITASRERYARPRAEVEAALLRRLGLTEVKPSDQPKQEVVRQPEAKPPRPSPTVPEPPGPPNPSEVPKPTELGPVQSAAAAPANNEPVPPVVVEAAPTATVEPAPLVAHKPPVPRDLGRGGAQHQAIQKRLKQAAEALGFRSTIEKQILDGQGGVDLLLERGDQALACEISITTTIDHEVGNVAKCLKAGFPKVAVICTEAERLKNIAAAVAGSLGSEMAARVIYSLPDPFIAQLEMLEPPVQKAPEAPETRRGYKIKRSAPKLTPEEQKQREEAAIRSIAETMRRKG